MKTITRNIYEIPGTDIEVELPYQPSFVMNFKAPLIAQVGDKVVVGYLADDHDCENPLTSCDGMGRIYECRRHGRTLRDYEQALGLADGGPDLGLVAEADVVVEQVNRLLADPDYKQRALEHCNDYWQRTDDETDDAFIRRCLDSIDELTSIVDVEAVQQDLWREGRKNGTIGDKHAVLLDVYEHSGISYSLSGQGMQCQFDTARAGAVWVPDRYAREEVVSRGEVYRKGDVNELRSGRYEVRTLRDDTSYTNVTHPDFESWREAYAYLQGLTVTYERDQTTAEQVAARELAKSAAEAYTAWCNGNCFGVVVATYDAAGVEVVHDACWGFIGDDDAYDSLKSDYFAPIVASLEKEHAAAD